MTHGIKAAFLAAALVTGCEESEGFRPFARAGDDQTVQVGETVGLDGTASSDADGVVETWSWMVLTRPEGSEAELEDASSATPSFSPDVEGSYQLALVVQDNDGLRSAPDVMGVEARAQNMRPVAVLDLSGDVGVGAEMTLDGSDSYDPEGEPLTYAFEVTVAPPTATAAIVHDDPSDDEATLVPDVTGLWILSLTVDDGRSSSTRVDVVVDVGTIINAAPVAVCGEDQSVQVGDTVQLDGSASYDPEGEPLSYQWTLAAPTGSASELSDPNAEAPTFVADLDDATWVATLEVFDGETWSDEPCQVTIVTGGVIVNDAPVADAGPDLSDTLPGNTMTLDGSGSSDPNGDPLTYHWVFASKPTASTLTDADITDATSDVASFVPDVVGDYRLQLTVCDPEPLCDTDEAIVAIGEIVNTPPDCDAGSDQTIVLGATVTLDGTGTTDADGDPLTYQWTILSAPTGATATLVDDTAAVASLTPDVDGAWEIQLEASDGTDSCTDTVSVTVNIENQPPVCDAGSDQVISLGDTVVLNGTGTTDPEGDPLTYLWTLLSVPAGAAAAIVDDTSDVAQLTPDVEGSWEIQLEVGDGTDSCTDTVVITVNPANAAPVCSAGPDQTIDLGDTATLDASGTTDADGDPLTYKWVLASVPTGSTATIASSTSVVATFTPDVAGSYRIVVWASDGTDTCRDAMWLTVVGTNTSPVADAGDDQQQCTLDTVDLDGSASADADGDALTYSWYFLSVPAGSALTDADIGGASSATASFEPDAMGTYEIALDVSDGTDTDTDVVTVVFDDQNAVLLLHLDEATGSVAADASAEGNDGAISGADWSGGRFMGSLEFDGSTSEVIVPDADSLDLTDDFTIDWWMRTDQVDNGYQVVLSKGSPYNYSVWTFQDELVFSAEQVDGDTFDLTGVASIGDGSWHHYAVLMDGGAVTIYEDGSALASGATTAELATHADDLAVGRPSWSTSAYHFEGGLDEVTIRAQALGGGEIVALARSETQFCTGDQDTAEPSATITAPADGDTSTLPYVKVEGTAEDESAIVLVEVNGVEAVATSTNYGTWVVYVSLAAGDNEISVSVEDIAGNVATAADTVTVTYAEASCVEDVALLLAFDEESSGTAFDWSDYGNDAAEVGTGRAVGAFGNAATFDGSSAHVVVPDDASLDLAGPYSVDFWYLRDGPSADWEFLFAKGYAYNYAAVVLGDGIGFSFMNTAGTAFAAYTTGFNDGAWHHVAAVYTGTNLLLYVDGTLEDTSAASGTPATNAYDVFIGGLGSGYYNFNGAIDQLRFHEEALSSSEVAALYAEGEACEVSDNLALAAIATASTQYSAAYGASNVIDDDTTEASTSDRTMWLGASATTGYVQLDLGDQKGVVRVRWANTHNTTWYDRATTDYRIQLSPTGSFRGEEADLAAGTGSLETELVFHTEDLATPATGRYLRFYVDDYTGNGGGLNEIQVYGLE